MRLGRLVLTPTPLPSGEGLKSLDFPLLLLLPMGEGGWEDVACFPKGGGNPLFSKAFKITFQVVL